MPPRVIVLCNAFDDVTRSQRDITTDSPAASHKVLLLCRALRRSGARVTVLSLGRGKPDGSFRFFSAAVRRVGGVPVLYVPFLHLSFASEIVSLVAPVGALLRIRRYRGPTTVLFYNRTPAYLPALLTATILRFRTVLDLEDGEVTPGAGLVRRTALAAIRWTFDHLCSGGALLACEALANMTALRPVQCYYGTVENPAERSKWDGSEVVVLFGGTVSTATGAGLLIEALYTLRRHTPEWSKHLRFEVTGKGDAIPALRELATGEGLPLVRTHGRLTDGDYTALLRRSHVGLALKPAIGPLASTTFPSKVVEFASHGLLVLTTDISDVRRVLQDGAVYIHEETPASLIEHLHWIVEHRGEAETLANRGAAAVSQRCSIASTSESLSQFLFDGRP